MTKTLLLVVATLFTLSAQAADPVSNKRLFQDRSKVCLAAADAAKAITIDTRRAGSYNPDAAILKHSSQGSEVRQVLEAALGERGIMRSVLIESAGFGASMLPREQRDDADQEIALFAYTSLFNQCVLEAMAKYGY